MKAFRLVPFVVAGLCGYLHTVVRSHFEVEDVLSQQMQVQHNTMISMDRTRQQAQVAASSSSSSTSANSNNGSTARTTTTVSSSLRRTSMKAFQESVPSYEPNKVKAEATKVFTPSAPNPKRVPAMSDEYQTALLQYNMKLLPNHQNPVKHQKQGDKDRAGSKTNGESDEDNNNEDEISPKPYPYNAIDIMVPASGQDDRLRTFARHLGTALQNFRDWYETQRRPAILRRLKQEEDEHVEVRPDSTNLELTFRLLVTRYPDDVQQTPREIKKLRKELSQLSGLPMKQIVLVQSQQSFKRAHARNMLHREACQEDHCIVTSLDVDIQVLPSFFHKALKRVKPNVQAYFPIVFSEFNPNTVQLVQDYLYPPEEEGDTNNNNNNGHTQDKGGEEEEEPELLPPFSKHRGLWRVFGYGMYVLSGPDVRRFHFNEQYQGWGHEDNDFHGLVQKSLKVHRENEHGLIHQWHPKDCSVGEDILTEQQWIDCMNSRDVMEGSELGMLLRPPLPPRTGFPGKNKKKKSKEEKEQHNDKEGERDEKEKEKEDVTSKNNEEEETKGEEEKKESQNTGEDDALKDKEQQEQEENGDASNQSGGEEEKEEEMAGDQSHRENKRKEGQEEEKKENVDEERTQLEATVRKLRNAPAMAARNIHNKRRKAHQREVASSAAVAHGDTVRA